MKKQIINICLSCGKRVDRKHKTTFGTWLDDCDMCGARQVECASAGHDFGFYETKEQKIADAIQDVF